MMGTLTLHRCSRCQEEHPWEELDPRAGQFDLLCGECLMLVRAEAEMRDATP